MGLPEPETIIAASFFMVLESLVTPDSSHLRPWLEMKMSLQGTIPVG